MLHCGTAAARHQRLLQFEAVQVLSDGHVEAPHHGHRLKVLDVAGAQVCNDRAVRFQHGDAADSVDVDDPERIDHVVVRRHRDQIISRDLPRAIVVGHGQLALCVLFKAKHVGLDHWTLEVVDSHRPRDLDHLGVAFVAAVCLELFVQPVYDVALRYHPNDLLVIVHIEYWNPMKVVLAQQGHDQHQRRLDWDKFSKIFAMK